MRDSRLCCPRCSAGPQKFNSTSSVLLFLNVLCLALTIYSLTSLVLTPHMTLLYPSHVESVGWKPEPHHRGTYQLISTCVATLLICVLSALHLDIPPKGRGAAYHTWRKVYWAMLGMLAPELMTLTAFLEYRAASTLASRVNELGIHAEVCCSITSCAQCSF